MSLTTSNGPAPTGLTANAFSPIFCSAVGEAIQSGVESKIWSMSAPSGRLRLIATVYGPVAVTDVTGQVGLQVHVDLRSRWMFHTTAAALSAVPSVNFTPWRMSSVTVLPPLLIGVAGGQVGDDRPLRPELEQLAVDGVHLALGGGAVDVRRRVQAGRPVTGVAVPLEDGERPAGLRRSLLGCVLVLAELLLLVLLHAAAVEGQQRRPSPRDRILRILFRPVEPNLMAFTHSISRHLAEST